MIYSRLQLTKNGIQHYKITDEYSIHRTIYSLFDRDHNNRILYSREYSSRQFLNYWILSSTLPSAVINEENGLLISKTLPQNFPDHDLYQFEVLINPVRKNNGKRIPIRKRQDIEEWFINKSSEYWGFDTTAIEVENVDVLRFKEKNLNSVTVSQTKIKGMLSVSDTEKFAKSFREGIGHAKTWGCGLIKIKPIIN